MATNPTTPTSNGSTDYYSQALAALQPSINAQVAPLQQEQANIPTLYANKEKSLTDQASTIKGLYDSLIAGNTNQSNISKEMISEDNTAQQGQARADAAARGIASTSGVEQSQESNIANRTALRLMQLDQTTNDKNTSLGIQESGQIQQITDEIAALPTQQSQDLLQIGAQIASVQGQGAASAFTYAADMAKLAADQTYKEAELAIQQENVDLAKQKIEQAAGFHADDVAIRSAQLKLQQKQQQIATAPKTTTEQTTNPWAKVPVIGGLLNLFHPAKTSTTVQGGWQ